MPKATPSPERYLERAAEMVGAAEMLHREGYAGDAVSKAYFAMFNCARALLALEKIYPRTHHGVVTEFGREFVKTRRISKRFGEALSEGKEHREEFDYDLPDTDPGE
ncbi:MAG TPA: HEPN domain-containing protein, partial [Ramlibacter sp.]|nr:HEPN domain-containing protein [Ramlibacter sp.]